MRRVQVELERLHEGRPVSPEWFDEQRLGDSSAPVGGPMANPTPRKDATR